MSVEQNKSIARRWIEDGWNKHNVNIIDDLYTPDVVQYDPATPGIVDSAEALKQYISRLLTAFPDIQITLDDLVAEGDKVFLRFTARGTHLGLFMDVPPSGRSATVAGMLLFHFKNSKIDTVWVNFDALGMLQQMGVIPMPNA